MQNFNLKATVYFSVVVGGMLDVKFSLNSELYRGERRGRGISIN